MAETFQTKNHFKAWLLQIAARYKVGLKRLVVSGGGRRVKASFVPDYTKVPAATAPPWTSYSSEDAALYGRRQAADALEKHLRLSLEGSMYAPGYKMMVKRSDRSGMKWHAFAELKS